MSLSNSKRNIQLDILRAVAILFVILNHVFNQPYQTGFLKPLALLMRTRLGWTGVDLFFVLSGFLIGGLLLSELKKRGRLDVGRFLIRRGFKIWPAYLVFVFFCFSTMVFIKHEPVRGTAIALLKNLLQVQNYSKGLRVFLWSLAVEEHFYLLLPIALLLITRRSSRGIHVLPMVTVGTMFLCLTLRIITWRLHPKHDVFIHHAPTHLRIDSLMVGVLLAYFFHFRPEVWDRFRNYRSQLLVASLVFLSPTLIYGMLSPITGTIGFTGLALGYGCLMLALLNTEPVGRWIKPAQLLASIGAYSYSIYLWHIDLGVVPAVWIVQRLPLRGGLAWLLIAVLASVLATIAGIVMSRIIETPSLALRDRLFPRYSGPFSDSHKTTFDSVREPVPIDG